jgi:protoporphyrinogen oxidase
MPTSALAERPLHVAIIGAGPAGLTAAYALAKSGAGVTVLEADPLHVGGISRTVNYRGYCFDIGGHRFFSKSAEIEQLWRELLPDDLLERPRSSRIYYRGHLFSYPLQAADALRKLGLLEATRCVLSYLRARVFPVKHPRSFEDWVTNQFGSRLFQIFFKTYTEKVWGMSCKEISADWAAQRIQGLSLTTAILNSLRSALPARSVDRRKVIKTLIHSFRYPRKGPGMMWEACTARVRALGGEVRLGQKVVGCSFDRKRQKWTVTYQSTDGEQQSLEADHVISSAPMRQLAQGISPPLSAAALKAAGSLRYRDFLTVAVILKDRQQFSDNWIYIHDPAVKVGRIQNFKSWSPEMVPDPATNCYGLEYFCFSGDKLWNSPDAELIELAKRELATIGLVDPADVIDGCVVRQPKAYPVYDDHYVENVRIVREELENRFPTLHLVGRNGMHKYNNQDHAMMTALLCAKNILAGRQIYDVWRVNQDAEYHEGQVDGSANAGATGERLVPTRIRPTREAPAESPRREHPLPTS